MTVTAPKGFRASGVTAGLKASGRPDLAQAGGEACFDGATRVVRLPAA